MSFTQPLFLLLLALLPYFVYLGLPKSRYGRGRAWAALVLRCVAVTLIALSLAGAQLVLGSDELAIVFLVDVSDSVSETEQKRAIAGFFVKGRNYFFSFLAFSSAITSSATFCGQGM